MKLPKLNDFEKKVVNNMLKTDTCQRDMQQCVNALTSGRATSGMELWCGGLQGTSVHEYESFMHAIRTKCARNP